MRRSLALATIGISLLLTGCQTGPRPTLQPLAPVNDTNAAPIVDDLEAARSRTFTAEYKITPTSAKKSTDATIVNNGGAFEVRIGEIGYSTDGTTAQTCTATSCEVGFNDSYVSDLGVTHVFWGSSFESRLRTDLQRNVGPTSASSKTIAGLEAHCVTIPLVGGSVEYCTLPGGPLASYIGADAAIELTSFTPSVAPSETAPGSAPGTTPGSQTGAPTSPATTPAASSTGSN